MANWLTAFYADRWEKRVWFPAEPPAEQAEEAESLFPLPPWGCPHHHPIFPAIKKERVALKEI